MAILNFHFTRILVEKKSKVTKQVSVKSGLNIKNVVKSEAINGTNQNAFSVEFTFEVKYEPNVGDINLEGELLYLANEDLAKEIEETWASKKALPKQIALTVFNRILHNCNVEALILSRELNLPAPVQLPRVKAEEKK